MYINIKMFYSSCEANVYYVHSNTDNFLLIIFQHFLSLGGSRLPPGVNATVPRLFGGVLESDEIRLQQRLLHCGSSHHQPVMSHAESIALHMVG